MNLRKLLKEYLELDDPTINHLLEKVNEEWIRFFEEWQDDVFNAALSPTEKLEILLGIQIEQRA